MNKVLKPIRLKTSSPIRHEVFNLLREAILSGRIPPGERLVERDVAEQFEASRTPVREAIRQLELEHLVRYVPRKGVIVAEVTPAHLVEIFTIRSVLEGLACRLAAEKITRRGASRLENSLAALEDACRSGDGSRVNIQHLKFHDAIYKLSDSPRLYQMISTLLEYVSWFARVGYSFQGRIEQAMEEHRATVKAIIGGQPDLAEATARAHVEASRQAYLVAVAQGQAAARDPAVT